MTQDVVIDISMDDVNRQLALEQEGIVEGINRYRQQRIDAIQHGKDMARLTPEFRLMQNVIEPVAKGIVIALMPDRNKKGLRFGTVRQALRKIEPYELAFLTVRRCLQIVSNEPLQRIAVTLGKNIENHLDYLNFKEEKPGYLRAVEESLKSTHAMHRHRVLTYTRHKMGIEDTNWSTEECFQAGRLLIDICIQATGCWEIFRFMKKEDMMVGLRPTDKLKQWIKDVDMRCEVLSPLFMPTVIPPVAWDDYRGGGYWTESREMKPTILRSRKKITREVFKEGDPTQVYKALNIIQATPWKINTFILDVMKECAKTGLAGLPNPDIELILPPKPWKDDAEFQKWEQERPEAVKEWKFARSQVYDKWHRSMSNRATLHFKLMLADKFKNEKAIWFPHNLDWRGRVYPIPAFLHPQGDDAAKGLLLFTEGKPLGQRGVYWLAVHLANTWGEDKVSFDDRIKWVHEHEKEILASVEDPLDFRWWMDADSPFCFLAACLEWAGYHREGMMFVSHIPVAMDGSCSGLQHFSGLLRDPVGGKSVNLVPSDKPADVYADVADVVNQILEQHVHDDSIWKGIKTNEKFTNKELANLWYGKVDRSVTKRNCMTKCYGATLRGYEDQLQQVVAKKDKPGQPFIDGDVFLACKYLAQVNDKAIGSVVVKAQEAMDWLQALARIVSKAQEVVKWTTPVGLKVVQDYRKSKTKQISTFFGKTRIRLGLRNDTDKVDSVGAANGLSPNFVHSFDAAHLMLTVLRCYDAYGLISFGLIHDSFGVHACDVDTLHGAIRDTFVEMYSTNRLQAFYHEVCSYLPSEVANQIPPPPQQGNLDLNEVRRSAYFFS